MKKFTFGTPEPLVPSRYCDGFHYVETETAFDVSRIAFRRTRGLNRHGARSRGCNFDDRIRLAGGVPPAAGTQGNAEAENQNNSSQFFTFHSFLLFPIVVLSCIVMPVGIVDIINKKWMNYKQFV